MGLAPSTVCYDRTLRFVLLGSLACCLSVLLSQVVRGVAILRYYGDSLYLDGLVAIVSVFYKRVTASLFHALFTLFLVDRFAPTVVACNRSLCANAGVRSCGFLSIFPQRETCVDYLYEGEGLVQLNGYHCLLSASVVGLGYLQCLVVLLVDVGYPLVVRSVHEGYY